MSAVGAGRPTDDSTTKSRCRGESVRSEGQRHRGGHWWIPVCGWQNPPLTGVVEDRVCRLVDDRNRGCGIYRVLKCQRLSRIAWRVDAWYRAGIGLHQSGANGEGAAPAIGL